MRPSDAICSACSCAAFISRPSRRSGDTPARLRSTLVRSAMPEMIPAAPPPPPPAADAMCGATGDMHPNSTSTMASGSLAVRRTMPRTGASYVPRVFPRKSARHAPLQVPDLSIGCSSGGPMQEAGQTGIVWPRKDCSEACRQPDAKGPRESRRDVRVAVRVCVVARVGEVFDVGLEPQALAHAEVDGGVGAH